ncbi:MAG: AMP-binding protein [bacterium]|nr:AMP-binding protein [bacterium]
MRNARSTRGQQQDAKWAEYVSALRGEAWTPFEEHWDRYLKVFSQRQNDDGPPIAWSPSPSVIENANLTALMRDIECDSYGQLHEWSVTHRDLFWDKVIRRLGIVFHDLPHKILDPGQGPSDEQWLVGARLNCVDSCFQPPRDATAIIAAREDSPGLCRTTYGQLEDLVDRVAQGLMRLGLSPGAGVVLYMPMTVDCVAAYLGVVRAGCHVVSVADSFSADELRRRIKIAGAAAVVTVTGYQRGGRWISLYDKVCDAEAPLSIVVRRAGDSPPSLRRGDMEWGDFIGNEPETTRAICNPDETTNILFSSGTTGDPKAIPWTHLTPIKAAMDGFLHQDIHARDVVAWPTNIGWMMGPWLIYASLINGATIALFDGAPTTPGFADFVADAGVTILGVVPSLVRAWRTRNAVGEGLWNRIRVFSSTGEPSSREDYLWLMSRAAYRAPVIEYCGGTEIGGGYLTGTVLQDASPATFTTPALGLDLVVFDEGGETQPVGEEGEVFLDPPSIGLSQCLLNRDHDEVYFSGCPGASNGRTLRRHGDRAMRLPFGFFRMQGRADDTMNLGGVKVSSLEIERVVNEHAGVAESAAVGFQSEGEGAEELVLFVVVSETANDTKQLRKELSQRIGRHLNPLFKVSRLVAMESLPRTASNKVMRRVLRDRLRLDK